MGCTKPNQQKSAEKNKISNPGPRFPNNQMNNNQMNCNQTNNDHTNNNQIDVTENVTEPVAPIRKRKRSKDAQLYTRLVSTYTQTVSFYFSTLTTSGALNCMTLIILLYTTVCSGHHLCTLLPLSH